jgi:cell division protein FtsL
MTPPAASASAQPLAPPRRRPATAPRPRRISGPAHPPVRAPARAPGTARPKPSSRPQTGQNGLILGLLGLLETVSSHRMLDRLIRGRMWIGIVAFALIGIVTLQLGLLKLNSSIGHSLEKEGTLQRENAALSIENSELAGGDRVESQAERLGMRLVAVGALQFLSSHATSDVPHAAAALKTPVKAPEASSEASSSSTEGSGEEASSSSGASSEATSESGSQSEETPSSTAQAPSPAAGEATESSSSEPPPSEAGATGTSATAPTTAEGGTAAPGG